jgi:hypothetical protein
MNKPPPAPQKIKPPRKSRPTTKDPANEPPPPGSPGTPILLQTQPAEWTNPDQDARPPAPTVTREAATDPDQERKIP